MNAPANMQSRVQDYLDERRRLGFQLKSAGRTFDELCPVRGCAGSSPLRPLTIGRHDRMGHGKDKQGNVIAPDDVGTAVQASCVHLPVICNSSNRATAIPDEAVFGPIPGAG